MRTGEQFTRNLRYRQSALNSDLDGMNFAKTVGSGSRWKMPWSCKLTISTEEVSLKVETVVAFLTAKYTEQKTGFDDGWNATGTQTTSLFSVLNVLLLIRSNVPESLGECRDKRFP